MYDFHYNYFKTKYGNYVRLFFTGNASFAYEIKTKDFYKDISSDVEKCFDTIDYQINHRSEIKTALNSKVLRMFNDDSGVKPIIEYVGLRTKLYSYKMLDGYENKQKCKEVSTNFVKRVLHLMTIESAYIVDRTNM